MEKSSAWRSVGSWARMHAGVRPDTASYDPVTQRAWACTSSRLPTPAPPRTSTNMEDKFALEKVGPHHMAFALPNEATGIELKERLKQHGVQTTPIGAAGPIAQDQGKIACQHGATRLVSTLRPVGLARQQRFGFASLSASRPGVGRQAREPGFPPPRSSVCARVRPQWDLADSEGPQGPKRADKRGR